MRHCSCHSKMNSMHPLCMLRLNFWMKRTFSARLIVLCFLFLVDYERLLHLAHRIDGQALVVELQEPEEEMPLDPRKLYVEELNPKTSNDCLKFYLEKFSGVDVEDIQFGCNNNALVTFESEPGNIRSYKKYC